MPTLTTHDVKITVETAYQNNRLNRHDGNHLFAYRITIENHGDYTIQLLHRYWFIQDLHHPNQEVSGEGVVGQMPIIEPGAKHQYVSGCSLQSEFGKMKGKYLMVQKTDGKRFEVQIPEFELIAPYRLN